METNATEQRNDDVASLIIKKENANHQLSTQCPPIHATQPMFQPSRETGKTPPVERSVKRRKIEKDVNAPKRNISAYLHYQNAMRDQFKLENPSMTFGEIRKYTSAMYAEMPPSEKESWIARAKADKQRYLRDLASYVPPPGYDSKGNATKRDSNAPKRNMSVFFLYQNAMRSQFTMENPGMSCSQLAKYTSCMYKNLTPEEKAIWVQRAEEDKKRYEQQIASYVPPPGYDARGNAIEDRSKRRNRRNPKDPDAPKQASGSYVFFTNEMRPIVMKQFPGIKFADIGRILGERWRALTAEEKIHYENLAAKDKLRFQVEMKQQATLEQHQHHQQQQQQHIDTGLEDPELLSGKYETL